jgi:hypothetical protein
MAVDPGDIAPLETTLQPTANSTLLYASECSVTAYNNKGEAFYCFICGVGKAMF